jgi:hypothetical protein
LEVEISRSSCPLAILPLSPSFLLFPAKLHASNSIRTTFGHAFSQPQSILCSRLEVSKSLPKRLCIGGHRVIAG